MRHLILSLLVLGFSQNLQAKLDVSKPSSENNESNKEYFECANRIEASGKVYLECVKSVKEEPVKSLSAGVVFKEPRSTASANNQQKENVRKLAQQEASNEQIFSEAHSCVARFTSDGFPDIECNGQRLNGMGKSDGFTKVISLANHYLAGAGFIPINCWPASYNFYCVYHKHSQN